MTIGRKRVGMGNGVTHGGSDDWMEEERKRGREV